MRARALIYHNVVDDGQASDIGRRDRYTLARRHFEAHLDAVERALPGAGVRIVTRVEHQPGEAAPSIPLVLTFDDGETGAFPLTAELLEQRGWRGQFFIISDLVGRPGHLDAEALQELHRRGHVIGTHSATHPARISSLSQSLLQDEWRRSVATLEGIVGDRVTLGSVPGGFYSKRVARAAMAAGLRQLYTSEPTARARRLDGCQILGRYAITRNTSAETVVALAVGRPMAVMSQALSWQIKKAAKRVGGNAYLRVRGRFIEG